MSDYPNEEIPTTSPAAPDTAETVTEYKPVIGHGPTPEEENFLHPPARAFNGIQTDPATGRLRPMAFNMVSTFENNLETGVRLTPTRFLYISQTGSDRTGDGTFEAPFASLLHTMRRVQPGDAVRILPGDYRLMVFRNPEFIQSMTMGDYFRDIRGTADAPIWIGGVPGMERPVLDGMLIHHSTYVIVHDLEINREFSGMGTHGFNVFGGEGTVAPDGTFKADAHHLIFRNIFVHNVGNSPFKFAGVSDIWLFDNEIAHDRNHEPQGIGDINTVGGHRFTIAYNYFHDSRRLSVKMKGGSADTNIFGNLFVNAGGGVSMGQQTGSGLFRPVLGNHPHEGTGVETEARNIRVFSNIFIGGFAPFAFSTGVGNYAVNNTIVLPNTSIIRIRNQNPGLNLIHDGGAHSGVIANNIFYYTDTISALISDSGDSFPETFPIENNLF